MDLWRRIMGGAPALVVARGVAFFFGVFSLANALVALVAHRNEDVWWLDVSFLSGPFPWVTNVIAAFALIEFAIRPNMPQSRRTLTVSVLGGLTAIAVVNSFQFFAAERAGMVQSAAGWPFSFVLACIFAALANVAWEARPHETPNRAWPGVAAVALACVILFPLAQVYFFGTSDYRRAADYAIIMGARVRDDGSLSGSLADRVLTGVELYSQGHVQRLIMSGGTGANGVDEAAAMAAFAERLGVPREVIEIDSGGVDTDATVVNTVAMLPDTARVLVVSQFYHLPRVKLAYRAAGREVYTVPARESLPIPKTPLFVVREIPGFWVYWLRAAGRDIFGV